MRSIRLILRPTFLVFAAAITFSSCLFLLIFPAEQQSIAFTLATGIGVSSLQEKVDQIEDKAIKKTPLQESERHFLSVLYRTMVTGARASIVLRQSADMMERYLSCSGEDLRTEPRIFVHNRKVQEVVAMLKREIVEDLSHDGLRDEYRSKSFYMPDVSSPDSVFGLYYGHIKARPSRPQGGLLSIKWRAEVPWEWPSYEKLKEDYGDPHAESFPLPNLLALLLGRNYALHVDNGLGEYLTRIGLARSFVVFAEWDEQMTPEENA